MQTSRNRYRCVGSSDPSLSSASRIEAPLRVANHDRARPQEINGEGEFPSSARQELRWWELDMTWWMVRGLQAFGLARRVKLPSLKEKGGSG